MVWCVGALVSRELVNVEIGDLIVKKLRTYSYDFCC
jgi:hypothetical protein